MLHFEIHELSRKSIYNINGLWNSCVFYNEYSRQARPDSEDNMMDSSENYLG